MESVAVATAVPVPPPRPPGQRALRLAARLYWLWPGLLTLGYGLWDVRRPALWADELATWGAVRLSWRSLVRLLGNVDAVVGPYYAVVKVWTQLAGTGTLALRLPSVLAMAAAASVLALLGAELAGRWAGALAGLILATTPATTRYAQEARPYAVTILLAVLATLLLVHLAQRPAPLICAGYAVCVLALGAAHLVALLLLPAHLLLVWRRALRPWAVAAGLGVLPLLPLALLGLRQAAQVSWIQPADWQALLATPETLFAAGAVAGVVIALALPALGRAPRRLVIAGWALVPVAGLYLISQVTPLYWPRYLLYTLPAWTLLAALTLARLSRPRAVALLAVLIVLGYPAQVAVREIDGHSHADSRAAGIIAANRRPGDAIAYKLDDQPEPWEARDLIERYVPPGRRPLDVFALAAQRTGGHLLAPECRDLAACLDAADPPRIWVLRFGVQTDPLAGLGQPKEELLRARYRLEHLWLVKGLTVALYGRG
jgi:mannosyltransferase